MPNTKWSELNPFQLGRYGEYYAKMEFASYGYDVYTSEVDDHGVDFVAKSPRDGQFYEIQVKSVRKTNYVYIPKDKMQLVPTRLVFLLLFTDGQLPACYLIPAQAWNHPDELLVSRDYGEAGQTSKPEWGINLSQKNLLKLADYRAESFFSAGSNQD